MYVDQAGTVTSTAFARLCQICTRDFIAAGSGPRGSRKAIWVTSSTLPSRTAHGPGLIAMTEGKSFAVPSSICIEAISSKHSLALSEPEAERIFIPSCGLSSVLK
jgi:hypothetical protein